MILPGSKNVRYDMDWLRQSGWERELSKYAQQRGQLGGICGGYQMLGQQIHDPAGVEGNAGSTPVLGLLPLETTLGQEKVLRHSIGDWTGLKTSVHGYEIHMGQTRALQPLAAAIRVTRRDDSATDARDGAVSADGRIWGTYFHGLFEKPAFRQAFLRQFQADFQLQNRQDDPLFRDQQYNLLAEHFRQHLDMDKLLELL